MALKPTIYGARGPIDPKNLPKPYDPGPIAPPASKAERRAARNAATFRAQADPKRASKPAPKKTPAQLATAAKARLQAAEDALYNKLFGTTKENQR